MIVFDYNLGTFTENVFSIPLNIQYTVHIVILA